MYKEVILKVNYIFSKYIFKKIFCKCNDIVYERPPFELKCGWMLRLSSKLKKLHFHVNRSSIFAMTIKLSHISTLTCSSYFFPRIFNTYRLNQGLCQQHLEYFFTLLESSEYSPKIFFALCSRLFRIIFSKTTQMLWQYS